MKARKSIFQTISTLILAVMLLVAPCSMRNAVERALDIEPTEISNKIKATSCTTFTALENVQTSEIGHLEVSIQPIPTFEDHRFALVPVREAKTPYTSGLHSPAGYVPLYRLYQHTKVYLG